MPRYELVLRYPDHEEIVAVSPSSARRLAVGGMVTARSHAWQIERTAELTDPPRRRYICVHSPARGDDPPPAFGSPDGPPFYMSTPMIKTQLEELLRELRPRRPWHKRVTARDLADYALDELDPRSADPRVWRALELAKVVRPRLG